MKLLIATHNKEKIEEFRHLMPQGLEVLGASDVGIDMDSFEEVESTLIGNALAKADYAFQKSGLLSIADDSGLFIEALPEILGVFSARFAPTLSYPEKVQEILRRLDGLDRSATMATAIAVVGRNYKNVIERQTWGHIALESRGEDGFEYDKIFIPNGSEETFSEMGLEKTNYSARKDALDDVLHYINRRLKGGL